MSRIHDALKRAEQERSLAHGPESAAATVVEPPPTFGETPVAGAEFHARTSSEPLLARCTTPIWKPDAKLEALFGSTSPPSGAEELRTLRSRLNQIREKQTLRSILITSAMPAEGKTFMTICLARMMVRQQGAKVLMIDADLRRPQLAAMLGAPSAPGLAEYLQGTADEGSILQRGIDPNLYLIPSGQHAENAAELISSPRLPKLLRKLETVFDWILVDSPPVVPVHDASVLSAICDGVLLVVRSASTAFDLAQRATTELRDRGLLGVILNQVEEGQSYQSYYYYYGNRDSGREVKQT